MRASTSASQAWGSMSFIFAVYADRRTMPNGLGDNLSLLRNRDMSSGLCVGAIRHSLATYSASRKASSRSFGRKRVSFPR